MTGQREEQNTYDLQRFVDAQSLVYADVCAELRGGQKKSHWMWFIFPQIKGLGLSGTSQRYAITGKGEAQAYLRHPVLGPRLRQCTQLVNSIVGLSITQIFSHPDYLKFRSCMTLFSEATSDNAEFTLALRKYFDGQPDPATLALL